MEKKEFKVAGMCCTSCITHIQSALETIPQIEGIHVQLEEPQVSFQLNGEIEERILIETINNAGHYEVVE